MNISLTYLLLNLGSLAFPLVRSFERRVRFVAYWPGLWVGLLLNALYCIPIDIWFTAKGNWGFSDAYTLGWKVFGLPVEEWMFFFCIPYACVFIYACVSKLLNVKDSWGWTAFAWAIVIVTGATALLNVDKEYTLLKLGSASVFLAFYIIFTKGKNLGRLMFSYILTEIPFLIVNGFLTSLPVVTYNNAENLGIRMSDVLGIRFLNIPVEDNVYSLLMLLLVVFGMEQIWPRLAKSGRHKSFESAKSDAEPIRTN